jgi:hypothetical protein
MEIEWSGPTGGLGNRMLALASASALSGLLNTKIAFTWTGSPVCLCRFSDLFSHIDGLREGPTTAGRGTRVNTCGWHPERIRKGFEKVLKVRIREDEYYYGMIRALRNVRYVPAVETHLSQFRKLRGGENTLSVHIRRGDRLDLHRRVYRHHIYAFNIIRNTGYVKSLQYLLLPEAWIRKIENEDIRRLVEAHLRDFPGSSCTLHGDSRESIEDLAGFLGQSGIPAVGYPLPFCRRGDDRREMFGIRETHPRDALVELLKMSMSRGIVRDNPASTFSLVAAIVGRVRINSRQPTHAFWVKIRKVLGAAPNEIKSENETVPN